MCPCGEVLTNIFASIEGPRRMDQVFKEISVELRRILSGLGEGAEVGPAIYDTAEVLRHSPCAEWLGGAYQWLREQ